MREWACRLTQHCWFQRIIILVILLAGLETSPGLLAKHGALLRTLDALVLSIFVLEAALKITALGWRYFRDGWNLFDFGIVVVCLLPVGGAFTAVLCLARTLRLLRLMSALPKLQLLVGALIKSFSSMGYVGLLLGIMFYIYAILGVHLFGRHSPDHFGSLPSALLTLFQLITLDNWADIHAEAASIAPAWLAAVYFISFILLGTMIMLNLFIGIIMNSMSEMHDELAGQNSTSSAKDDLLRLERQLDAMKKQLAVLRDKIPS